MERKRYYENQLPISSSEDGGGGNNQNGGGEESSLSSSSNDPASVEPLKCETVEPETKMANLGSNLTKNNEATISTANSDRSQSVTSNLSSSSSSNHITAPVQSDGRTTLFISGLPQDTKPRELYLMCRLMAGYERSVLQIKSVKHTPVGFVTFATRQQATSAKQALNGMRFDPNDSRTIRVEFARKPTIDISNNQASGPTPAHHHLAASIASISPPLLPTPTGAAAFPGLRPIATAQHHHHQVTLLNLATLLQNGGFQSAPGTTSILTLNGVPLQSPLPPPPPGSANGIELNSPAAFTFFPFK